MSSSIIQKHRIIYNGKEIEFQIIKSHRRRKTSLISIEYGDVIIRTPISKSTYDIEYLIEEKAEWILQKIRESLKDKPDIKIPSYKDNSTLPYLGTSFSLKIIKDKREQLIFSDGMFIGYTFKTNVKAMYRKWLFSVAHSTFNTFVEKYTKLLNVKPKKILIKDLKSRWGSATFEGNINLNVNLIKAPLDIIEYVVLHEFSHLIERNHSKRFWKVIEDHMFDYKNKIKWLRINGYNILQ